MKALEKKFKMIERMGERMLKGWGREARGGGFTPVSSLHHGPCLLRRGDRSEGPDSLFSCRLLRNMAANIQASTIDQPTATELLTSDNLCC
jgi:hypothetical protein